MERLRQRDYRAVLGFLEQIYASGKPEEFPDRLVEGLGNLIPCEVASYDEMNPNQHTSIDRLGPAGPAGPAGLMTPEFMHQRWEPVMHEHPGLIHSQRTGDLRAHRISEFLSEAQYHRLALYHEYYRKIGIEDALCKAVRVSGPVVIGCGLHRGSRSFTDRDSMIFDLLGPHVTQAWRAARAMGRMRNRFSAINRGAEAMNCGAVTVSPDGRTDCMTAQTRSLLVEFFGGSFIGDHHLPDVLAGWFREQKEQFARDRLPHPLTPLRIERKAVRLIVRLVPGADQDLLLLQKQSLAPDYSRLEALGLTTREAEVLVWVAKGKTNEEIGLVLAVSSRTVQKHLEHIFIKLGVETRTAAAAQVTSDMVQR